MFLKGSFVVTGCQILATFVSDCSKRCQLAIY